MKGRSNLILSRNPDFAPEGAEVFPNVEALLSAAPEDSFVLGGASVYRALLDRCDTAYVTKVRASFPADCWFPDLDRDPGWKIQEESAPLEHQGLTYRYITYRRR